MKLRTLLFICTSYLLLIGTASASGMYTFPATLPVYASLSNVQGTSNSSDDVIRSVGETQIAASFRLAAGLSSLPAGTTFQVIWQDGTSELVLVVSVTSSLGAVPIPGTQRAAGDSRKPKGRIGGGGGGSGGGPSGGGSGSGGGDPGPVNVPVASGEWGCVTVDGGNTYQCQWFPDTGTGA